MPPKAHAKPNKSTADDDDGRFYEKSLDVAWAIVHDKLVRTFSEHNNNFLTELKCLILACNSKRAELRELHLAKQQWTQWFQQTDALEVENALLQSIINLLDGPNGLLTQLQQFTENQLLSPILTRLSLVGFNHPGDLQLSSLTSNARQFAVDIQDEIHAFEKLSESLETIADQIETCDVPACRSRIKRLLFTAQQFAYEASLRIQKMQTDWLESFLTP